MVNSWWVSAVEIVDKGHPFDFLPFELPIQVRMDLMPTKTLGRCDKALLEGDALSFFNLGLVSGIGV